MHIVRLLGLWSDVDDNKYIVTEFVEKGSLKIFLQCKKIFFFLK
jgi:hypothetical protein